MTPLHVALLGNSVDAVRCLLKYGAAINKGINPESMSLVSELEPRSTPLHMASIDIRLPSLTRLLLDNGADLTLRDNVRFPHFRCSLPFRSYFLSSRSTPFLFIFSFIYLFLLAVDYLPFPPSFSFSSISLLMSPSPSLPPPPSPHHHTDPKDGPSHVLFDG